MPRVRGFPPVADRRAEILVLGSMPGAVSLAAGEYYANPHNAFWRIMAALLDLDEGLAYDRRIRALKAARIALWDVLRTCERRGSGDAAIDRRSLVVNDFAGFFRRHARVRRVYFNGAAAEALYRRHVLPGIGADRVAYRRLPSTSPAHAALPFAGKLAAWREIVGRR
ncbi:MAG: DNA-deoxyinosine glycosylase [Burkholderiales bacterium]|nr:DNA-deoxyinosine glycosylase [Burkholderiales bacterium]